MSTPRRIRLVLGCLVVLAIILIGLDAGVRAQQVQVQVINGGVAQLVPNGPVGKEKESQRADVFSYHMDDTKAPKIIDSVIKHLRPELPADEWKDIITNLQALLDEPSDRLVEWTDPLSKDRKPKLESIRNVANKLIGRFSKQGRDFYQREAGPKADQRLKDAIEKGDYRLVNDVSLRYFHTKAGAEATVLMGRNHLDRGRYTAAAETFRRFMDRNHDDPVPLQVNFLAALSCKRIAVLAAAGNDRDTKELYQKYADNLWDKVKQEIGGKEVAFGPKKVTLAQLEKVYAQGIDLPKDLNLSEWNMVRGNAQNNGQGVGGRPFLDPIWSFSMTPILQKEDQETKGSGMKWIEDNLKTFMQYIDQRPNQPPIPAMFPVASAGKVIFRTYDGIYCLATRDIPNDDPKLEVKSGEMLWMVECEGSLFNMVREGGRRSQIDSQWKVHYQQQGPFGIFFENGLIGSLSHDGSLVYFVDDMALPPHPQYMMQFGLNGQPMTFGGYFDGMVRHNKLNALYLDSGKLAWKAGGPEPSNKKAPVPGEEVQETAQSLLSGAYFLGAPLPLAGKLYVVIEKDRELRLVCLNPTVIDPVTHHPELVWSQPLGSPNVPLPTETLRRIQGIHLAYSDNTLVVPTNAGAVLGIDLLSHSIIWARSYRLLQEGTAGMPDGVQPQIGVRGRIPINNQNQTLNADRWRTSAPIISAGKVVFTAYDANSIMCLSLRDGEILWEVARSSDDLYVGGVFDNKVLVVGKNAVKFLDLNKGTQVGMVNTGTPSGVGTASNDVYYLPLRASRDNPEPLIASIDTKKMEILARTRSRKKVPAGNLVFFDNAVYSQSPFAVTAFPQLDIKIQEAKKRLDANPNDAFGLAEMGDLSLDNGKRVEAIDFYNRSLANNPGVETRAKAREKLYDAITELLQSDFNAGERMLDQYKELCTVDVLDSDDPLARQRKADEELRRKSNYFCLVAKGKEGQGKLLEAYDNYLAFGTLTGNKDLVSVIDQPNTYARPDVWARGRINNMIEKAPPEQRKPLQDKARQEWEAVKKAGDLERLRNFVRIFGTGFEAGNEARLMLAEKLIATNGEEDLRDAENVLLGLKGLDEPVYAARATEALARLYIRKGLFDDAMGLYGDLHRLYPTVALSDGKTGADVFNDLVTDKRFLPYLEPLRQTWMHTRMRAKEDQVQNVAQQMQSFTISPDGESIPFYNRHKVVIDMMTPQGNAQWTLKVVDRVTGEEKFRSSGLPAAQHLYMHHPTTNNHRFAQIRGHLLLLNLNNMVYAFDLADRKKLWDYNLFGKMPMPQTAPVRVENEVDGVRLYYQDGWTQKVGQIGVIEANYVCLITREGLVAVDPARGTVLWTKSNVSSRVQLMGDENYVFVFESNAEGGVTTARAIRAADGVEVQIQDSSQVFSNIKKSKTAGRRVLVLDEKGDKKSMRLYDILTGKDDWKKEIEGNATMLRCEDPNLTGYVSDKGDVVVFSVKDGKEVFTAKLDQKNLAGQMNKVDNAVLLTDRERFFVVLNRPLEGNNQFQNQPSLTPGIRTLRVNGHMYCFDRRTGKRLWRTDEQFENQQIILDQFQDLPIVIGAHWYNRINNGVFEGNGLKVVAIDKRTGSALFRKEVAPNGAFYALNSDPKTGTVELIRADLRIKFTPDDGKPSSAADTPPVAATGTTPPNRGRVIIRQQVPVQIQPANP